MVYYNLGYIFESLVISSISYEDEISKSSNIAKKLAGEDETGFKETSSLNSSG